MHTCTYCFDQNTYGRIDKYYTVIYMAESTTAQSTESASNETDPLVSALLSLAIPGLGHIIHGQSVRGGIILALSVVLGGMLVVFTVITLGLGIVMWVFWPIIHILAAIDAYFQAGKVNSGEVQI